jgi:methionyl aminopeptidase
MHPIMIKSQAEIEIMKTGGAKLREVKEEIRERIKEEVSADELEGLADSLIKKSGGVASFKMVPGYHWATCVNVNEGIVHGIPKKEVVFKKGDVVSVDLGLFYKGFHTDTSITESIEPDSKTTNFLNVGKKALENAIDNAVAGNHIHDISDAIEKTITSGGYTPLRALIGHGVGRELHEEPKIPCYVSEARENTPEIKVGMTLAIEVMYTIGNPNISLDPDGWTIFMRDGKISALYEDTVAVTENGPEVLT